MMDDSIVLKFGMCNDCGTYGVARYWKDGSFRILVDGCAKHGKTNPYKPHQEIQAALAAERRK